MPNPTFLFGPVPHQEAVDFIKDKPVVTRDVFNGLLPELKAKAFVITGVEGANVLQAVRDRIADLPAGANWDDVKKDIVDDISPFLVDPNAEPEHRDGQIMAANRRAELLLRTHGFQAYQAASYQVMDRQRDVLPFWQYLTMEDERVRPEHAALDQIVLPQDHPFWQTHFPPWDFGCRCQVVPISQEDRDDIAKADAKRPTDGKLVIDDVQAHHLALGQLVREGRSYDVRPPTQKEGASGYSWNPGDVRIPIEALRARYDAPVWAEFEAWAKQTPLHEEGGKTVWDWIGGKPADAWPDLTRLKTIKKLGGSTGALLVQSPEGQLFVQKKGNSTEHLLNEFAADNAYRAMGLNVPEAKIYETPQGPVKLAKFVDGKTLASLKGKAYDAAVAEVKKGFAADVLLGNYDVIGLDKDNILVDADGKVWRIDNGGSFDFRAQGAKKAGWNPFVKELWTMRDAKVNASSASVFGDLSIYDIARQIEKLEVGEMLAQVPETLRAVMIERVKNLEDVERKALDMEHDAWKDGYADQLTFHMMGLREAGVTAALPARMVQDGETGLKDENGLDWDHLRTHAQAQMLGSGLVADQHAASILGIIKHINHHGQGDKVITKAKLTELAKIEKNLKNLLVTQPVGSDEYQAAEHYLKKIAEAKASAKTVTGTFVPVTHFEAYKPKAKAPAAAPQESVVAKAARYIESIGGDQKLAAAWMESQAGNSWSSTARAYKHFIFQNNDANLKQIYWKNSLAVCKKDYESLAAIPGADKLRDSLISYHAFVQEVLAKTDFGYNDRERRAVRLTRTESLAGMTTNKVTKGKSRTMARGLNESSSIYRRVSVSGTEMTVQAVPHSRVTGMYFMERSAGYREGSFMSDGENEFTFIPNGIPFDYVNSVDTAGRETDATQWGIDLTHLRTK